MAKLKAKESASSMFSRIDNNLRMYIKNNLEKLQKKDKELLKDDVLYINTLTDELYGIWSKAFTHDYKKNETVNISKAKDIDKAKDRLLNKGSFSLSNIVKQSSTFNKDEKVRDTKKRKRREDARDAAIAERNKSDLKRSNYSKEYLNYRLNEVSRNFTKEYNTKVKKAIAEYINTTKKDTREVNERHLYNLLSLKRYSDLSKADRAEYFDRFISKKQLDQLARSKGRLRYIKDSYGLRKEVIDNPKLYDTDAYKKVLENRINRIAATELNAAYNIGRLNYFTDKGIRYYVWKSGVEQNCSFCNSLVNKILDMNKSVLNNYYTKFSDYKKTVPVDEQLTGSIVPPVHGYCDCYLEPIEDEKDWDKVKQLPLFTSRNNAAYIKEIESYFVLPTSRKTKQNKKDINTSLSMLKLLVTGLDQGVGLYNLVNKELTRQELEQYEEEKAKERLNTILLSAGALSIGTAALFLLLNHSKIKSQLTESSKEIVEDIRTQGNSKNLEVLKKQVPEIKRTVETAKTTLEISSELVAKDQRFTKVKELKRLVESKVKQAEARVKRTKEQVKQADEVIKDVVEDIVKNDEIEELVEIVDEESNKVKDKTILRQVKKILDDIYKVEVSIDNLLTRQKEVVKEFNEYNSVNYYRDITTSKGTKKRVKTDEYKQFELKYAKVYRDILTKQPTLTKLKEDLGNKRKLVFKISSLIRKYREQEKYYGELKVTYGRGLDSQVIDLNGEGMTRVVSRLLNKVNQIQPKPEVMSKINKERIKRTNEVERLNRIYLSTSARVQAKTI